ncbi:MAG: RNA methyltransferase [Desulfobacteraceae bacterium]|nr:MAG: RNA methyltransferase [Desulfobacteraceae bacterium]
MGLVHFPVYNKNYRRIASAITTLDLHDIARLARTYAVKRFFVITPLDDQKILAERVRSHWTNGYGAKYNCHRKEAIELVEIVPSLERAIDAIETAEGEAPLVIATDASRQNDRSISYERARCIIQDERVVVLIFGTAWGLDKAVMAGADYVLDPICGRTKYNHLSVRTAAAIILDRLTGR